MTFDAEKYTLTFWADTSQGRSLLLLLRRRQLLYCCCCRLSAVVAGGKPPALPIPVFSVC